jgi:SAM-dependent methyltransferase
LLINSEIGTEKFDKIFCVNVVYFWNNLDIPFAKIFQSLKAGGVFCIYMVTPDVLSKLKFTKKGIFNSYSVEEVMVRLEQAGFKDIVRLYGKGSVIRAGK